MKSLRLDEGERGEERVTEDNTDGQDSELRGREGEDCHHHRASVCLDGWLANAMTTSRREREN